MGLRGILLWPFYRLADWADDNPVSAIGAVVALGALAVLLTSVSLGAGADGGLALDAHTATTFADTALERPAYAVAAAVGLAVALFYNG